MPCDASGTPEPVSTCLYEQKLKSLREQIQTVLVGKLANLNVLLYYRITCVEEYCLVFFLNSCLSCLFLKKLYSICAVLLTQKA